MAVPSSGGVSGRVAGILATAVPIRGGWSGRVAGILATSQEGGGAENACGRREKRGSATPQNHEPSHLPILGKLGTRTSPAPAGGAPDRQLEQVV